MASEERLLEGAFNHYELEDLPRAKIFLSVQVYKKCRDLLKLCKCSGDKQYEYGNYLYGIEYEPNQIYFHKSGSYQDHILSWRETDLSHDSNGKISQIHKELLKKIEEDNLDCDCIAHVHTHPYVREYGVCSGYYSNQDMHMLKTLQLDFQPTTRSKKSFLGCLLALTEHQKEISFVFYDDTVDRYFKATDINIIDSSGVTMPLPHRNGRTLLELT